MNSVQKIIILIYFLQISMSRRDAKANGIKYNLAGHKMTSEELKEVNMKMRENNKVC